MAITASDLLAPLGPIEVGFFPGENVPGTTPGLTVLEERLTSYISQAEDLNAPYSFPDMDLANKYWALHLTFRAAYLVAVSRPAAENAQVEVIGSFNYSRDQRDALLANAEYYKSQYLIVKSTIPTTMSQVGVPTRSTPIIYDW